MRYKVLIGILLSFLCFASCHYPRPDLDDENLTAEQRDSLAYLYDRHYTWNANLELVTDSVNLACLPVKDCYNPLYRGDRVVVAEFAVHPEDSVDTVWVKLAHTQEVQGWLPESVMKQNFVPTDSISQAIYLFCNTSAPYFIIAFALFFFVLLFYIDFRRNLRNLPSFCDVESFYFTTLFFLMALSATLYETMQHFAPETWEHFYFNPTLSPFDVPPILALFLGNLWLALIALLAFVDVCFRRTTPFKAFYTLLYYISYCIIGYFIYLFTTRFYVGYLLALRIIFTFSRRLYRSLRIPRYRCGQCGQPISQTGPCPHCGAVNDLA